MVRIMEKGYFVRLNDEGLDKAGLDEGLSCLESIAHQLGGERIRVYNAISTMFAVLPDEAVDKLREQGYFVEPENVFRALPSKYVQNRR